MRNEGAGKAGRPRVAEQGRTAQSNARHRGGRGGSQWVKDGAV